MKLCELAPVIRTKNAGPYWITADIIFDSPSIYAGVKRSRTITREKVAALYQVQLEQVGEIIYYDAGYLIKINIKRPFPSGGIGDTDILAMQQHAPLLEMEFPLYYFL